MRKKRCPISRKIHNSQWQYHHSRTPWRKYGQTKSRCKISKTQFLLSFDEFLELSQKPCYYCNQYLGDTGCGLDRVDNTVGYCITNVVPCCNHCNSMKRNLPLDIFLNKIKNIYNNLLAKEELPKV